MTNTKTSENLVSHQDSFSKLDKLSNREGSAINDTKEFEAYCKTNTDEEGLPGMLQN